MDLCWSVAVGSRLQPKQWRDIKTCSQIAYFWKHAQTLLNELDIPEWQPAEIILWPIVFAGPALMGREVGMILGLYNPLYERPKTYRIHIYKLRVQEDFCIVKRNTFICQALNDLAMVRI